MSKLDDLKRISPELRQVRADDQDATAESIRQFIKDKNDQIERWLNEDDPRRQAKIASINNSPDYKAAYREYVNAMRSAGDNFEPQLIAANKLNQSLERIKSAVGLRSSPEINAPERLLWWIENNPARQLRIEDALPGRLARTGNVYVPSPEAKAEITSLLRKASDYALSIRRSNPILPRVPDHNDDKPHTWLSALVQWCIEAKAKLDEWAREPKFVPNSARGHFVPNYSPSKASGSIVSKADVKDALIEAIKSTNVNPTDPKRQNKMDRLAESFQAELSIHDKKAIAEQYLKENPTASKSAVEKAAKLGKGFYSRHKSDWLEMRSKVTGKDRRGRRLRDDEGDVRDFQSIK